MKPEEFAAARAVRLDRADDELRPSVREALRLYQDGQDNWADDLILDASALWIEVFSTEAPDANRGIALARFRRELTASLKHTAVPTEANFDASVERVTYWISGYTVNSATTYGAFQNGVRYKRWTTMHDDAVREVHVVMDGQIVPISGTFTVAGESLRFPGEPVGDPEVWINCRCLAMPAARDGEAMSSTTYTIGPDDSVLEENPDIVEGYDLVMAAGTHTFDMAGVIVDTPVGESDTPEEMVPDEPEDGEELITEIPVHGVSTVEGRPTGDGRGFRVGALVFDVPQPLGYEFEHGHGGDNSRVAIIGRIDEIFRHEIEDGVNEIRWRGVVLLSKEYAAQALDSIADGSYTGASVIVDDVTVDVEEMKAEMRKRVEAEEAAEDGDYDFVDEFIGDGTTPTTWFSAARQRRLDMVPTGAFPEAFVGFGSLFEDELDEEQRAALTACGCAEEEFRDVPTEERNRRAEDGTAMPDGSYPIGDCDDLRNAIQAIGRASDPEATKRHIRKRKAALGCEDVEIPDTWSLAAGGAVTPGRMPLVGKYGPEAIIPLIAFAPGTKDGPGWITHPVPTARIRRYWVSGEGAAKIKWGVPGDFNRCRVQLAKYVQNPEWLAGLCANMHYEALGIWPATHGKESHAVQASGATVERAPILRLLASARTTYDAALFEAPQLDHAAPVRIDRDSRRIYGYLAEWGTCHVGITGFCQEVPQSYNEYAYFLKGRVQTDAGEQRVGTLTYGIGHASERMRAAAATAHYDQTEAVRAYVNMGEDVLGVWFSGVLAPWVTDSDIDAIEAIGAFSGDWRDWGQGTLDLIGAVCVNTPGFQLVASGGVQTAMIGTNVHKEESVVASANMTVNVQMDADTVGAITRTAVAEYRHQEKVAATVGPLREKVRAQVLASARARVERV